ncbi:MAG: DUF4365 domain-containing protein [Rikenellaceae bacterium]|nr:DUF4365 domain-containing protein [Rikenellaceae bacterium]
MDSAKIEMLAVSAVKDMVVDTDILHPFIAEGDKEPSWDGFIYIYKDETRKKDNLKGRVAVQVKGIKNNNFESKITFPVEVADLKNYLHNGGVIYFVVYIHKTDNKKRKVYYETLAPVKINNYLQGIGKQKTKTINLKEFPADRNDRTSIIVNFFDHSIMQTSYAKGGFISLEDIGTANNEYSYSIQISGYGHKTPNTLFSSLQDELYIYVTPKGTNALIPTDTVIASMEAKQEIVGDIAVGGKVYYRSYHSITSPEGTSLKIGDSITIHMGNFDNITVTTTIQFTPCMRKLAKDMEFLVDVINTGRFNLGSVELELNSIDDGYSEFIYDVQKRLTFYNKIIQMLDILNVEDDINIDELTDDNKRNIETLVRAFIDKKDITNITAETPSVLDLKINNILLKLIVNKKENGAYEIQNFFESEVEVSYKDLDGSHLVTSPYSALSKDDYLHVSNINHSKIIDSYKKVVLINPNVFDRANIDMLQMLSAYDEALEQKLLSAAKSVAGWILNDGNNIGENIKILNYLQIIKRERSLNKDEKRQLSIMSEDSNATEQEKVGAYLLLDNQISAEIHFEKIKPEEQELFRTFPIYKFWNSATE